MKRTNKSKTPMADKIQTIIPRYGELNRVYRDYYIDNHVFSFDRQKFISDFIPAEILLVLLLPGKPKQI